MRIKFLKDYGDFKRGQMAEAPAQMLPENAVRLIKDRYAIRVDDGSAAEATAENKKAKRAKRTKVVKPA